VSSDWKLKISLTLNLYSITEKLNLNSNKIYTFRKFWIYFSTKTLSNNRH